MNLFFVCLVWLVLAAGGAVGQTGLPHRFTLGTPAQQELDRLGQWASANPQLAQQPAYQVIWAEALVLAGQIDKAFEVLQKLDIALHPRPVADTLRLQAGLIWVALHRLYQNNAQAHQRATEVFNVAPAASRQRAQAAVALCLVPGPRADSALAVLRQATHSGTVRPECQAFVDAIRAQQSGEWGRAFNAPFPAAPAGSPAPVPGADLRTHLAIRRNELLLQTGLLPLALHNTALVFNELQLLYGPRHPLALAAQTQYAEALALGGWHPEAQANFAAANAGCMATFRGAHPATVDGLRRWAYGLLWAADTTQALAKVQMARAFVLQGQPVDSLVLAELSLFKAEIDRAQNRENSEDSAIWSRLCSLYPETHLLHRRALALIQPVFYRQVDRLHSLRFKYKVRNTRSSLPQSSGEDASFSMALIADTREALTLLADGITHKAYLWVFSNLMENNEVDTNEILNLFHHAQVRDAVWHTLRWGATRMGTERLCPYDSLLANAAGCNSLGISGPHFPPPTPEHTRYSDNLNQDASMLAEVATWPITPHRPYRVQPGEAQIYLALADSVLLFLVRTPAGATARRVGLSGLTAQRIQLLTTGLAENNFTMLRGAAYFLFQDLVQPWLGLLPGGTQEIVIHPVGVLAEVPFSVLLPAVPESEDPAVWPYFGNQFRLEYGIALPGNRPESAAMNNFEDAPQPLAGPAVGQWQWHGPQIREAAINLPPTGAALPQQPIGWAFAAAGYSAWVGHQPEVIVLPCMRQPAAFVAQLAGQAAFTAIAVQRAGQTLRRSPATAFPSFWAPAQGWRRR